MQKVQATHCVVIMQCGINQGQSNQPLTGKRLPSFQIVVREHDFFVNWQLASAIESGWDISTRWMRNGTMAQYWLSDSMHIESKENCILILGNGQENITEYFIHKGTFLKHNLSSLRICRVVELPEFAL
ncbi:uncharacterized protein [Primulina eburnea]|uniref:uncharacterized protein isoform X2 n=1 Tax=Primulina eburnea TaxID=1245227 RepID=UPI003C6C24E5